MKTKSIISALILWAAALMLSGCFVPYYDNEGGGYRDGGGHRDGGGKRDGGGHRDGGERH